MADYHGRFVWYELITTDVERARSFYANVLGWGTQEVAMPGMAYTLFTVGEASVSGLMSLPEDAKKMGAKPHWIGYVGVDDVDATDDRIKQLGGVVHVPPTDIPNVGRFSIVADPQMATLALLERLQPGQDPTHLFISGIGDRRRRRDRNSRHSAQKLERRREGAEC